MSNLFLISLGKKTNSFCGRFFDKMHHCTFVAAVAAGQRKASIGQRPAKPVQTSCISGDESYRLLIRPMGKDCR